jgi:hypothetical protein
MATPTNHAQSPPSNVGFRADQLDEAAIDELGAAWKLNRSEVLRRLVRAAAKSEKVRQAVEHAAHEHRPGAERYRVVRGGVVGIKMGVGVVPVPTEFRAGQVIAVAHFPAGYIQRLIEHGILLEALPD